MKKTLFIFAALLPLASCIDVDDFGAYWDKTGMDKRLAGGWKEVADSSQTREHGLDVGHVIRFVNKNGAYEMSSHTDEKTAGDEPIYPIKTLKVESYEFLPRAATGKEAV